MGVSTELKVGAFVLVAIALVVGGYVYSVDGIRADEAAYELTLLAPTADGLFVGSYVRVAGVDVGSVEEIAVEGDRARIDLLVRERYELPIDSTAEVKSSGLLGDRYVRLNPGTDERMLAGGDRIELRTEPGDIDEITRKVEDISADVAAITAVLREVVEDDSNRRHVEATLANVDALSDELRLIAEQNHHDINAIVDSVRRLTEGMEGFTDSLQSDVELEMDKLHETTDALDEAMRDIESITGKVDRGEGTIGALVNDDETIDALNDTIDEVNSVVEGISGIKTEVYYTGRWYVGSQPADTETFFYGNPLANSGSNTVGMRLKPQEDYWYIFEVNDYPQGTVNYTEHYFPDSGTVYTEWVREPNYRFTFQLAKRWWNLALRLGVKENGGGIGATMWMFDDRLSVHGDLFDFSLSSYPATETLYPNLRLFARLEPIDRLYLDVGSEQLFLGLAYDYQTGFIGGGFHFNDDDIRWLLAFLPLPI